MFHRITFYCTKSVIYHNTDEKNSNLIVYVFPSILPYIFVLPSKYFNKLWK